MILKFHVSKILLALKSIKRYSPFGGFHANGCKLKERNGSNNLSFLRSVIFFERLKVEGYKSTSKRN